MNVTDVFVWLIALIVIFYIFKNVFKKMEIMYYVQKMPGPPTLNLLFGNMRPLHDPPDKAFKTMRKWSLEYYPIYKLWISHVAAVNVVSPEDMELVMSNTKHIKKSIVYNLLHRWLGTGLLTSTGQKWQTRRKLLTPSFHFNILQDFLLTFNEKTEELVKSCMDNCAKPFIEINPLITQFTLKTISETTMGIKMEFNNKKEISYRQAFHDLVQIIVLRIFRPWIFYTFLFVFNPMFYTELRLVKELHKFTKDVITAKEKDFNSNQLSKDLKKKKRLAMLDLLFTIKNDERSIDDEGIREEVDTFMFEGHDTTAVGISFAFMLLACHRDVQDKIVEEMREVLVDIKKKPTYNELQELKFMERCIKEILRMYPSVPYISRELGEDLITHSGYKLKKGTIVQLHIYDTHHNPNVYPNPEKFDPDRFLPENTQNRHPFAFIPFSGGPRNCIGQRFAMLEMKAVLCGILGNFILEPIDTPETIVLVLDLVLRTKDNIKLKFVPRPE